ncbi:serine protease SP24D-like [Drosophila pseudoobscura]|uniref:trypsin n=1 Tax=Drosophila pseudoobscura pseudoobscura TaxID=46245 RepID=A0A6I8UGI8_DROPS|nr:serine protease SP24D [Drosophila pseudoobscura]
MLAPGFALTIAVAVVGCCLLPAGHSAPSGGIDGRIVGGEDAALGQFPHQVSLRNAGSHSCGGSILSRNYILTAAHCVTNDADENGVHTPIAASRFTIRAGTNDRFSGGVLLQVAEVIVHENYGDFLNDIALLRLESPLFYSNNIKAIALPTANTPAGADIIISGWGRIKHQGDLPRYLQYNTVKSISVEECGELIDFGVESELCLLHPADNGACNGDSGGPAVYNDQVVGIAGFVYGSCGSTYPDGYARVHYFNDWIRQHLDV